MRILIVTSYHPPLGASGHDVRCEQVAAALSRRGHRLQVLTSNHRVPPMGVQGDKGVFRELNLAASLGEDELIHLSYKDALNLDYNNAAALDYRMARFKPELILIWDCSSLSKSLLMRLQDNGIPVAYDLHNRCLISSVFQQDPWQWWWKKNQSFGAKWKRFMMTLSGGRRRILRKFPVYEPEDLDFSKVWFASQSIRSAYREDGESSLADAAVVYPALQQPQEGVKQDYLETKRRFMWAGRLSSGKAPELALEAVAKLKEAGKSVSLDIFGMGEPIERKAIRERINAMGLADCVNMIGIRFGEIADHYPKYSALLYTSRCDDPFSMTVMEAMHAGLPCIVSDDGGISEIVEDGHQALVCARDDVDALVRAMLRFDELPDGGQGLAASCRERLQERFTMDLYMDHIEQIICSNTPSETT